VQSAAARALLQQPVPQALHLLLLLLLRPVFLLQAALLAQLLPQVPQLLLPLQLLQAPAALVELQLQG
jgi:hypothetical protein